VLHSIKATVLLSLCNPSIAFNHKEIRAERLNLTNSSLVQFLILWFHSSQILLHRKSPKELYKTTTTPF
jgi:hypothetical protein